jgi:hypothetical protein
MKIPIKFILLLFFVNYCTILFAQQNEEENNTIYNTFNQFFDQEIKKQGVKGNWIFALNEITSLHNFDFNNDGLLDVLFEFNAKPVDGGSYTLYFVVLFQNLSNNQFKLINYLESTDLTFIEFYNNEFIFKNSKSNQELSYSLQDSKFIKN